MPRTSRESSLDRATHVCTSCKKRKRRCDKAVPKCSSCSKRNLACEYLTPEQSGSSASPSDRFWYGHLVDDDQTADVQSIDFPTMLFLDPGILQHGQIDIPRASPPVPTHILQLLGDLNDIRVTASNFFDHIHLWMPFISKKRFYDLYLRPSFQSRPDIVLLFLAIKLITTLPPTNPRNPRTLLYHATKHFYLEVESSNTLSVPVLQTGVLLALYEIGHGIYPAAFLSIGACARYAYALGINSSRTLNTKRVLTLVEVEERRRVWWAIVILDRFVNVGCPGRPFATADPELDDLLPADDASWDQGIVRPDDSFTLSSPMTGHMSKFALLCQAARLLGHVLRHVSTESAPCDNVWMQLDRTLHSMAAASLNMDSPDYDQITFIYSALIALHKPWLYSGKSGMVDTDRSRRARDVLQGLTNKITTSLIEKHCFLGRHPDDMSPWGLFFAYHICGIHMNSSEMTAETSEIVDHLKETFLTLNVRWNVAGVYLQLLEAREVMNKF